jgi:hypothetical protein
LVMARKVFYRLPKYHRIRASFELLFILTS